MLADLDSVKILGGRDQHIDRQREQKETTESREAQAGHKEESDPKHGELESLPPLRHGFSISTKM